MNATARKTTEIRNGTRIVFRDGEGEKAGIVNGEPWIMWNGESVFVAIPVHVTFGNWNGLVWSENVVDVKS